MCSSSTKVAITGTLVRTMNENIYQAGVLVNHGAKLKGVAKASDYTKKPGI